MPSCKLVMIVFTAACVVAAQHVDPEVLLLSRMKSFLHYEFTHLPDYTCLETISRFQRPSQKVTKFTPLETARLEIACSEHHEWYGLPGARELSVNNPAHLAVGPGLIATGMFSTTLHNLFFGGAAIIKPRGDDIIDGRKAVRFDYRFPAGSNIATINLLRGSGAVNEEGSIWIDPQSLELLRLDGHVTEIPPSLPLTLMEFTVVFARTRVGDFDALLAQSADLHMIQSDGIEDYDRVDFTHCRMFHAESTLSFDTIPDADPNAPLDSTHHDSARLKPGDAIPEHLRITVQLDSRITRHDVAGKLIEGHVAGEVRRRGKVVLEDGAPVHGRIRRIQEIAGAERFLVALEFTEARAHGVPLRFYADLVAVQKSNGLQSAPRERVLLPDLPSGVAQIALPELPGVASLLVEGEQLDLPAGLRTVWRTRGFKDEYHEPPRDSRVMTPPPVP